jgi:hypothetical protein
MKWDDVQSFSGGLIFEEIFFMEEVPEPFEYLKEGDYLEQ